MSVATFGSELPDQVDVISSVSDTQLKLLGDIRDLVRERAALEKDYAAKLQAMSRKAQEKKSRLMPALTLGDYPTKVWSEDAVKKTTFDRAYNQLLVSLDQTAEDHIKLADDMLLQISEDLKGLEKSYGDRQAKQTAFYQKLLSERDKSFNDQVKTKQKYYEECREFESYRQKQDRAHGDRHAERAAKQYESQKVEMTNCKNSYIISTAAANEAKAKFYEVDLPRLENQYQMLQARLTSTLVRIVGDFESLNLGHLDSLRTRHTEVQDALAQVDTVTDQTLFVEFNRRPFTLPAPLEFEACPDFYDAGEISMDGEGKVYLQNRLARSRGKMSEVEAAVQSKENDVQRLNDVIATYDANPNLGKAEEVVDNLIEAEHGFTLLLTVQRAVKAELDLLQTSLGDDEGDQQPHNFKSASFSLPAPCAYCKASIWGLSKQGKTCRDCGLSVHMKCELKVPANCHGTHGPRVTTSKQVSHITSTESRVSSKLAPHAANLTASAFAAAPLHEEVYQTATVLFAYDSSSPYELTVREGALVSVLEEDDGSGWVKVMDESGTRGLVPASYIQHQQEPHASLHGHGHQAAAVERVRGIYDYAAQGDDEISIQVGQIIELTTGANGGRNYGEGWWEGVDQNQRKGIFPSNYVEAV